MDELDYSVMDEFSKYLDEYKAGVNAPIELNERIPDILNMGYAELNALNPEDCLSCAYELGAHAMYLQSELNENQARLNWTKDVLDYVCSKEWGNYDNFLKYDIKRMSIINGNSFAESVEKLRSRLNARVTLLGEKLPDLRKMIDILENLSKRKAYK